MIPILHSETETQFESNGIAVLHDTLNYQVTEELNGEYDLYLRYPADGDWANEFKDMRQILAKPNDTTESHAFRIYEIEKSLEDRAIYIYATTRTNDLAGNLVSHVEVVDLNPQQALDLMKTKLVEPTNYNFISDIITPASTTWSMQNPLSCIAGQYGSITQYWGGEIERTNDTIFVHSRRGRDNVMVIREGRGLDGFNMTVSTKGLITRILPVLKFHDEETNEEITIQGDVLDSPLMNNYPVRYIHVVDYSDDESILTVADLNRAAQSYFTVQNPGCDKPKVDMDIDLIQLSDSSEYDEFKALEHVGIGDTVTAYVKKFDVDVLVKVNKVVYDGMKEQTIRINAGSKKSSLYDDVRNNYTEQINEVRKYISGVENGLQNSIQVSASGKATIFRGYTEPPVSIANTNDLWYQPVGAGEVVMNRFNGVGWVPEKLSAGLLAGVIDGDSGDLDLINLNADSITSGSLDLSRGIKIGNGAKPVLSVDAQGNVEMNLQKLTIRDRSIEETIEEAKSVVATFSPETILVPEVADIRDYTQSKTTIQVLRGAEDVTHEWTIAPTPSANISGVLGTGTFDPIRNLFSIKNMLEGFYIETNGVVTAHSGSLTSDFIPVDRTKAMIFNTFGFGTYHGIAEYDANKVLIPGSVSYPTVDKTTPLIIAPSMWEPKTAFVRWHPDSPVPFGTTRYMVESGTTPNTWRPAIEDVPPAALGPIDYKITNINGTNGWVDFELFKGTHKLSRRVPVLVAGESTDGQSAYELAVEQGYTGTLEQWIVSLKGEDGANGVAGVKGADGRTSYFHTAWADDATGSTGFSTSVSTGKTYIGTYSDFTQANSSNPTSYKWVKIKGETGPKGLDGAQGLPGPKGADGSDRFTWIKYADTAAGAGISDSPLNKLYMGIAYNKLTATESVTPTDYTWSLIQGPKGANGTQGIQGPPGANGLPTYTWIKYADTDKGVGMSDNPAGKRYLGLAYNKTTATKSTVATDYQWSPLFDNIQIGGRNLYVKHTALPGFVSTTGTISPPSADMEETSDFIRVDPSNEYVYSSWVEIPTTSSSWNGMGLYDINKVFIKRVTFQLSISGVDEIYITEFLKQHFTANTAYIRVGSRYLQTGLAQVSRGNVITDWQLSPEDYDKLISEKADNSTVGDLSTIIGDIADAVVGKVDIGELEKLQLDFNERVTQNRLDADQLMTDLSTLEGRTLFVENILGEKTEKWTFIEQAITFGDEGILVGNDTTRTGLLLKSDRISFMSNDVEVAFVAGGTMQINHAIFVESATIDMMQIQALFPGSDILAFNYVGT